MAVRLRVLVALSIVAFSEAISFNLRGEKYFKSNNIDGNIVVTQADIDRATAEAVAGDNLAITDIKTSPSSEEDKLKLADTLREEQTGHEMHRSMPQAPPPPVYNEMSSGSSSGDAKAKLAQLEEQKRQAIESEDFTEAQRLKTEIAATKKEIAAQAQSAPQIDQAKLAQLKQQKKEAIEREDYGEAGRIKQEIDELKAQANRPSPVMETVQPEPRPEPRSAPEAEAVQPQKPEVSAATTVQQVEQAAINSTKTRKLSERESKEMAEFDAKHPDISGEKEKEFQMQVRKVMDETLGGENEEEAEMEMKVHELKRNKKRGKGYESVQEVKDKMKQEREAAKRREKELKGFDKFFSGMGASLNSPPAPSSSASSESSGAPKSDPSLAMMSSLMGGLMGGGSSNGLDGMMSSLMGAASGGAQESHANDAGKADLMSSLTKLAKGASGDSTDLLGSLQALAQGKPLPKEAAAPKAEAPAPEEPAKVEEVAAPAPEASNKVEEVDAAPAKEAHAKVEEVAVKAPEEPAKVEETAVKAPAEPAKVEEVATKVEEVKPAVSEPATQEPAPAAPAKSEEPAPAVVTAVATQEVAAPAAPAADASAPPADDDASAEDAEKAAAEIDAEVSDEFKGSS